jgi:hypothetical protein
MSADQIWILEKHQDLRAVIKISAGNVMIAEQRRDNARGEWLQVYDGPAAIPLSIAALNKLVSVLPEVLDAIDPPAEPPCASAAPPKKIKSARKGARQ